MITFKEFEEVWDESRVLSDLAKVISSAEGENYIEVKVYESIDGIDISSSVRLGSDDKEDIVELLKKLWHGNSADLKSRVLIFTKNTKNQKLPPKIVCNQFKSVGGINCLATT